MTTNKASRSRSLLSGGRITLRAVRESDRAQVRQLCQAAHEESLLSQFPIQMARVDEVLDQILSPKTVDIGMVAETDVNGQAKIVGLLHATAAPHLYLDLLHANCQLLYVTPDARHTLAAYKLVRHFIRLSANSGVQSMSVHVSSGSRIAQTNSFLKKMGFDFLGGNYQLLIKAKSEKA